ncbi:MAG: hypothetical protein ACK5T6_13490 [Pirellula sp.]
MLSGYFIGKLVGWVGFSLGQLFFQLRFSFLFGRLEFELEFFGLLLAELFAAIHAVQKQEYGDTQ